MCIPNAKVYLGYAQLRSFFYNRCLNTSFYFRWVVFAVGGSSIKSITLMPSFDQDKIPLHLETIYWPPSFFLLCRNNCFASTSSFASSDVIYEWGLSFKCQGRNSQKANSNIFITLRCFYTKTLNNVILHRDNIGKCCIFSPFSSLSCFNQFWYQSV